MIGFVAMIAISASIPLGSGVGVCVGLQKGWLPGITAFVCSALLVFNVVFWSIVALSVISSLG
ncbi:MAG: hypothetical protein QM775_08080 [Pirellulales bacterium]